MQILSPVFENNTMLPALYTCDGKGINPPLAFSGITTDTKSLALVVEDPDAPSKTFIHWIVYNMLPNTAEITEGTWPENAVLGITSLNKPGYVAACPPSGVHRYIFTLYALDIMLPTEDVYTKNTLAFAMQGHILATSQLIGLYQRPTPSKNASN
ncbi:MAG TPA: YbhB/YbcL family Raf kinase inhibitor-like protein [Patescibacteria group bacterium]|nr:YbhB/YbcL family Raf kinase inhibitor-like protein [Patescibacteria group bacterium]